MTLIVGQLEANFRIRSSIRWENMRVHISSCLLREVWKYGRKFSPQKSLHL